MKTLFSAPAFDPRKRSALTVAVVISAVALFAGMIVSPRMTALSPERCGTSVVLVLPFLVALIPHFDILVRLWRGQSQKGIMLALVMGSAGLSLALLTMTPVIRDVWLFDSRLPFVLAMPQAVLLATGVWAYVSIRRNSHERPPLAWACGALLGYGVLIVVLGAIGTPPFDNPGRRFYSNQARAATFMREVPLLQHAFSEATGGFSPTLATLADSKAEGMPEGIPLSTNELLTRQEDQGYIYTYMPGPLDNTGQIHAYTITARPRIHAVTGCLNLYSDESGLVRATKEDRPATSRDPQLGG